jgi:hypothetical protein
VSDTGEGPRTDPVRLALDAENRRLGQGPTCADAPQPQHLDGTLTPVPHRGAKWHKGSGRIVDNVVTTML